MRRAFRRPLPSRRDRGRGVRHGTRCRTSGLISLRWRAAIRHARRTNALRFS